MGNNLLANDGVVDAAFAEEVQAVLHGHRLVGSALANRALRFRHNGLDVGLYQTLRLQISQHHWSDEPGLIVNCITTFLRHKVMQLVVMVADFLTLALFVVLSLQVNHLNNRFS